MNDLHRYYMLYRPPMPGAIPKCTVSAEGFDSRRLVQEIGREAWGYVDCWRELTQDEIEEYELIPAAYCR